MAEAIVVAEDLLMRARLEAEARKAGFAVTSAATPPPLPAEEPSVLVVDLDAAAALEAVEPWRRRFADLRILGFCSHVDRERWEQAEAMGIEVHPRGASQRAASLLSL